MATILDADDPAVRQALPYRMPELHEDMTVQLNGPSSETITLNAGSDEMLKISEQGFWVRGVQVPQDEREAKIVYDAFREWMTWASLTRKY
jgi:hypothetical protein